MKGLSRPSSKMGYYCTGIALVLAIIGVSFASEEIYQQGDSTAIIRQSGGGGPSESQVIRHEDGHTIITRDGRNTDITVQRRGPIPPGGGPSTTGSERFDRWLSEE
ncbi:MAG: hypothetical protein R6X17_15705 [Candidatus Competibacteraceae bacterium]